MQIALNSFIASVTRLRHTTHRVLSADGNSALDFSVYVSSTDLYCTLPFLQKPSKIVHFLIKLWGWCRTKVLLLLLYYKKWNWCVEKLWLVLSS